MRQADLRLPILGVAAWSGGLLGALASVDPSAGRLLATAAGIALATGAVLLRGPRRLLMCGVLAAVLAAAAVGVLKQHQLARSPLAGLAEHHAAVVLEGTVASDPRLLHGRFGTTVSVRLSVRSLRTGDEVLRLRDPVQVLGDAGWRRVTLGSTVRVEGRLAPPYDARTVATLVPRGPVRVSGAPRPWWQAAAAVRASIRRAVAGRPEPQRALVPALVDGDDAAVPDEVSQDFTTTGLTHLLAVSGTNLTLLVGFLLLLARWCRVRGRWLYAVGVLGILCFVLLARAEPSVLRAAVMGAVGLLAMGSNGRQRGLRCLGAALLALMLVDPALATSTGFALSASATAGILVLGPPWRDALARWLPRWMAEAVAIPTAAQLACTPLVAVVSGRVSLAAVGANLVAEPAVGPATVLGLAAGLLGLVWPPLGVLAGTAASWCVAWIAWIARRGAALPGAGLAWGGDVRAILLLTLLTAAVALVGPRLVRHRAVGLGAALLLVVAVTVRLPTPGWPPRGWVLVVCDVGQGDAIAVRTGPGSALVVDAGPDPRSARHCLDDLGIRAVPLLVLTHYHADHVDGLAGVLAGRHVAAVETTRLADPPLGVAEVASATRSRGLAVRPAPYGSTRQVGEATVQVLWPPPDSPLRGPGDGSTANEASVVLLVATHGLRVLLTGDIEPEGQVVLARELPGLRVDVLKIPHHGSRYQDEPWLVSLRPAVAIASVGADNDYGHPATSTLAPLARSGAAVYRTDRDGAVAVVAANGRAEVVTH